MSKHTQQEWQRDGTTVYALNVEGANRFVAQVQGGWAKQGRNRTEAEEIEANAVLIAAAPDLLKACRRVMERYVHVLGGLSDEALDEVQAAISKATGQ